MFKKIILKRYKKQIKRLKEKYNASFISEKNRLISILNHDIKTPLLAHIQTIGMFCEGKFGFVNEVQKDILKEILNSNQFLLEVISNSLFLMRYENEKADLKLEKINIKQEIENCVEIIKRQAKEKSQNIVIKANKNIKVEADKILIQKIILNLLTSSMNYGFENSDIEVCVKESRRKISFYAKNKSIYMTKEKLESLFQDKKESLSDFNRLGMSLNLNIAKKLIQAHHWDVVAQSEKNNSSVFGFVIKK